jgi:hypothetical protein
MPSLSGRTSRGVNGFAWNVADEKGWCDIESIWKDDPECANDPIFSR